MFHETNRLNKLITLLVATACVVAGIARAASYSTKATMTRPSPGLGDQAPLLEACTLLQAPPGTKLDAASLRGKVVVLEFWATWCGPCIAAIPRLNRLAERFKDQPVQFVAITAEDE